MYPLLGSPLIVSPREVKRGRRSGLTLKVVGYEDVSEESRVNEGKVFAYDPLDVGSEYLAQWRLAITHGVPEASNGFARAKMRHDQLVTGARGHDALLGASGALISREILEQVPSLKCIGKMGIGYEVVDVQAATELGVVVVNTPIHSEVDLVAEHAVSLMLACVKQFGWYNTNYVRDGGWRDPRHFASTLRGATVGIVGYGNIGRAVAQRLRGFECRIVAYDVRTLDDSELVQQVSLEDLLGLSDIVTLHTPAVASGPLLNAERLASMKSGAVLINTARGRLVDPYALRDLLDCGQLSGYAADVFDPEPPAADDVLVSCSATYLTPHVAAWNQAIRQEMVSVALEGITDVLKGVRPRNVVNPDVYERGLRK